MRAWLVVLAVLLVVVPPASATRPAPANLRVHEWGVWKIRAGQIAHLHDLRRESPAFVRQAIGGGASPGGAVSRKPVVYLYADRPTDVTFRVGFTGGNPWLFFPGVSMEGGGPRDCLRGPVRRDRAMAMPCEPVDHLRWRVRAQPAGDTRSLAAVDRAHFWNDLRAVPSALLTATDGSAEKFLFYDGPVAFPEAYRSRREGDVAILERTGVAGASDLVLANGDRWVAVSGLERGLAARMSLGRTWPSRTHPVATEIGRRLRAAGLSDAEARSLVETWRPEIEAAGLRAFWLLARSDYDALLPIEVSPAPTEVVRVGLVIESL